jgi:acetyl esterase/lipase
MDRSIAPLLPLIALACAAAPARITAAPPTPSPVETGLLVPEQERLWPQGAPDARGEAPTDQPAITTYRPAPGTGNGTAIIVNPGGGYRVLVGDHEGAQAARWFARHGITAFVLRYRLLESYPPELALVDAQRAIRWVRYNAPKFGLSTRRIGMAGFSAGANLATAAATHTGMETPDAVDPIDRVSSRPDFVVPVYPAISREFLKKGAFIATDERVTEETPPTFLVHTHPDRLLSLHSLRYYEALHKHGIPAALHVFGHGAHGMGMGTGDPDLARWPELLIDWLRRQRFLTDAERVAIDVTVQVDGKPLHWGWITLIPENTNLPIAARLIDSGARGHVAFDLETGPCAGRYRLEAHLLGTPDANLKTGEPSLLDPVAIRTASPGDPKPIWVDVKAGQPINIDIKTR